MRIRWRVSQSGEVEIDPAEIADWLLINNKDVTHAKKNVRCVAIDHIESDIYNEALDEPLTNAEDVDAVVAAVAAILATHDS